MPGIQLLCRALHKAPSLIRLLVGLRRLQRAVSPTTATTDKGARSTHHGILKGAKFTCCTAVQHWPVHRTFHRPMACAVGCVLKPQHTVALYWPWLAATHSTPKRCLKHRPRQARVLSSACGYFLLVAKSHHSLNHRPCTAPAQHVVARAQFPAPARTRLRRCGGALQPPQRWRLGHVLSVSACSGLSGKQCCP